LDRVSTGSDSDLVVIGVKIFAKDFGLSWWTRSLSLPVLTRSKNDFRGAMESRFVGNVKGVQPNDVRDREWRPVAEYDHPFTRVPRDLSESEQGDLSVWYYWNDPRREPS